MKAAIFYIAGVQFHDYKAAIATGALNKGEVLDLVLEPDNPYDNQAVAIYWQGLKLGYIPMKNQAEFKELIYKQGVDKCKCVLNELKTEEVTHRMFEVIVEVEE